MGCQMRGLLRLTNDMSLSSWSSCNFEVANVSASRTVRHHTLRAKTFLLSFLLLVI